MRQRNATIFSQDQIQELSEIILRIECHYDFPCDIEWAHEWWQFFIVQSRPITTLQTISQPTSRKIKLIFTRDHNQWMNEIVDYVFVHILPHVFGAGLSTQITYFNGRTSERRRFGDEVWAIKNAVLCKNCDDKLFTQETQEKFLQDVQYILQFTINKRDWK